MYFLTLPKIFLKKKTYITNFLNINKVCVIRVFLNKQVNFNQILTKFDNSLCGYSFQHKIYISSGMFISLLNLSSKSIRKTIQQYLLSYQIFTKLFTQQFSIIIKPLTLRYFLLNFDDKLVANYFILLNNPTKFKAYRRVKKWLKKDYKKQENLLI